MTKYGKAIEAIARNVQRKNGYSWDLCLKIARTIYEREGRNV